MPRKSDINSAFHAAIQRNPKGYRYLRTSDFIRELAERNWHFSELDANKWIERYQHGFCDKTDTETDDRYWILRNMGRVF